MSGKDLAVPSEHLDRLIYEIRGQKVMLDSDLARLYGVPTFRLNEAVKRNRDRFPDDFTFQVTREEFARLISQIAISSSGHGGRRKLPWAFTEHGAIMAANVLNSPQAVQMSVFVVRAFLKMRAALSDTRDLARKLAALETELKERLNVHEAAIVTILQRVMDIIDPPALPAPPKKDTCHALRGRLPRLPVEARRVRRSLGREDGRAKSGQGSQGAVSHPRRSVVFQVEARRRDNGKG